MNMELVYSDSYIVVITVNAITDVICPVFDSYMTKMEDRSKHITMFSLTYEFLIFDENRHGVRQKMSG